MFGTGHNRSLCKKGGKIKQTDGLLASYGYLEVAYKTRDKKYIIKTVKIK